MEQWVKLQLEGVGSEPHAIVWDFVLPQSSLLLICLRGNNDPSAGAPATCVGHPDGIFGSRLQLTQAWLLQQFGEWISRFFSATLPLKQINNRCFKKCFN